MMKRNDIILFGTVVFLAVIAIFIININKSGGSKVAITVDGKEYKTLDLNTDTKLNIGHNNGDYNSIEIKDGVVAMMDANCPDKLCVKHAKIHYNGETIVCLPHKIVLQIINGEDNGIDMIAK